MKHGQTERIVRVKFISTKEKERAWQLMGELKEFDKITFVSDGSYEFTPDQLQLLDEHHIGYQKLKDQAPC